MFTHVYPLPVDDATPETRRTKTKRPDSPIVRPNLSNWTNRVQPRKPLHSANYHLQEPSGHQDVMALNGTLNNNKSSINGFLLKTPMAAVNLKPQKDKSLQKKVPNKFENAWELEQYKLLIGQYDVPKSPSPSNSISQIIDLEEYETIPEKPKPRTTSSFKIEKITEEEELGLKERFIPKFSNASSKTLSQSTSRDNFFKTPYKSRFLEQTQSSPFFTDKWMQDLRNGLCRSNENQQKIAQQTRVATELKQQRDEIQRLKLEKSKQLLQQKLKILHPEDQEEETPYLPEITPEMEAVIDEVLYPSPGDDIIVEGFRLSLRKKDFETLPGLNWLNDEIINFYMNLLMERSTLDNYPSVYAFNTFFYTKLIQGGHSTLKRWTRKIDIFSYDLILIPVHLGVHWCLAVIDFRHKKIQYYDSMKAKNIECLNSIKAYLQDERKDKKKETYDMSNWTLECVKNIPAQGNGSDCGMFTLKYAEYISRDAKISFTQADMPYFRKLMIYEMKMKKLL